MRARTTVAAALVVALALPAGVALADTDHARTDRHTIDHRPADRPDTRTEVFPVGNIGAVELTWTTTAIIDVDVRAAEGWHHRSVRRDRQNVAVVFFDGEHGAIFRAHLSRDGLRTSVARLPHRDGRG